MVLELAKDGKEMLPLKQRDVRETSGVTSQPTIGNFTDSQHTHADAAGGGLTTHKSGSGADHANVALNDTHRASDGTGHANVALNDTHRASVGTDHANVVTNTADVATNVTAIGLNTTHRGSNGSDHSLIANKTSYWSTSAPNFTTNNPDTDQVTIGSSSDLNADADGIQVLVPVSLPQGAVVTACIMHGNAAAEAETWTLARVAYAGGTSTLATAAINTADTSIDVATIDNSLYAYFIYTSTIDTDDVVKTVLITYTTDYI